jgi:hypothetical protein
MSAPSLAVPSTGVRRLSATEATRDNIKMGPTVVVPPQHLMAPSKATEIASAFETARHHLDSAVSPGSPGYTPPETSVTDKYAFAFGELCHIRVKQVFPNTYQISTVFSSEVADQSQKQLKP